MAEALTIARPYAKAIFELAKAQGQYKKWTDLLDLLSVIVRDPQVEALIKAPMVPSIDKASFIATMDNKIFDEQGRELVQILVAAGRLLVVPEISALYEKYCAEEKQTLVVDVCSAIPLEPKQKEELQLTIAKYFHKTVLVSWREDPSLIGGMIVKAEDKVFDGSVRGQLQALHKELVAH